MRKGHEACDWWEAGAATLIAMFDGGRKLESTTSDRLVVKVAYAKSYFMMAG